MFCIKCNVMLEHCEPKCPKCGEWQAKRTDPVNRPSHYTQGKIECIDAIESALTPEQFIGFLRGTQMKYAWRAGIKEPSLVCQDIDKQIWYANREKEFRSK